MVNNDKTLNSVLTQRNNVLTDNGIVRVYATPEIGDIIYFDESYYEVDNVQWTRLIGGQPTIYNKTTGEFEDARMFLTTICHMVRRSQVQIEDRVR